MSERRRQRQTGSQVWRCMTKFPGAKSVQTAASCIPKLTEISKIYLLVLVDREGPVAGYRIAQISRETRENIRMREREWESECEREHATFICENFIDKEGVL
jgi:hypothetical protein